MTLTTCPSTTLAATGQNPSQLVQTTFLEDAAAPVFESLLSRQTVGHRAPPPAIRLRPGPRPIMHQSKKIPLGQASDHGCRLVRVDRACRFSRCHGTDLNLKCHKKHLWMVKENGIRLFTCRQYAANACPIGMQQPFRGTRRGGGGTGRHCRAESGGMSDAKTPDARKQGPRDPQEPGFPQGETDTEGADGRESGMKIGLNEWSRAWCNQIKIRLAPVNYLYSVTCLPWKAYHAIHLGGCQGRRPCIAVTMNDSNG